MAANISLPPLLALQGRRVLTASRQPQIWAQASPIMFSADLDFPPQGPQRTVGQGEQTWVTKPQGAFPLCWSEQTDSEVLSPLGCLCQKQGRVGHWSRCHPCPSPLPSLAHLAPVHSLCPLTLCSAGW